MPSEKRFFVSREKENPDPGRLSAVFDIVGAHLTSAKWRCKRGASSASRTLNYSNLPSFDLHCGEAGEKKNNFADFLAADQHAEAISASLSGICGKAELGG